MSESSSEWPALMADGEGADEHFQLTLFVAGLSALSRRAIVNTRQICEQHLEGRYELEIVDLAKDPHLAISEQIIAAPTLLKRSPLPVRRFVGDMSRVSVILKGLGLPDPSESPDKKNS